MNRGGVSFRLLKDAVFRNLVIAAALLVVPPLLLLLFHLVRAGFGSLNLDFVTRTPKAAGESGGGILNGIVGTMHILLVATAVALPIGIAGGLYLSEMRTHRFARLAKNCVNILQGVPSIVIGIVMYEWIVVPLRGFSVLAGGIALGVMMLPVIMKSTEETVALVPAGLREASFALGATYRATMVRVVLPTASAGILNGAMLAIARVAGETAPLLFTAFGNPYLSINPLRPTAAIPLIIYDYAKSPYEDWIEKAWGASLVLVLFVLAINLFVVLRRPPKKG